MGTIIPSSTIGNRLLFTGREYNSQFGFYEYRARAYHPGLGRFMSEDPIGFDAGDYNLYRYCKNDPLDRTDPMGLRDVDVYIWEMYYVPRRYFSVGHVMVTEHGSREVLLSQFPRAAHEPARLRGLNHKLSFADTLKEERRPPDKVLVVHVPNDNAFDAAVNDHVNRKYWDKYPQKKDETHCSRAAYDALKKGGVPLSGQDKGQILPGYFGGILERVVKERREREQQQKAREAQTIREAQTN